MNWKSRDWRKVLRNGLIFLAVLPVLVGAVYFGNFYAHTAQFNDFYKVGDRKGVEAELQEMRSYYATVSGIPVVGWLANKVIFDDMPIYEARHFYIRGDYENVYDVLEGVEDWRADHIRGNALYRTAKKLYRADRYGKTEIREAMVNDAKRFYGSAVRNSPDANFDDVWNYDLIWDEERRQRSFETGPRKRRVKLGFQPGGEESEQGNNQSPKGLLPNHGNNAGGGGDGPRTP